MEKLEKRYQIRSYECDRFGLLRIVTLMNILQDAADLSATSLGFGFDFCLQNKLAWVGTNYCIDIKKMPKMHDVITVQTWPSGENKFMALRDFAITNEKGEPIILATSQWVLVDALKKRPVSLDQHLPKFMYISERALNAEFAKLPEFERVDFSKTFEARFDDIDLNVHVNNAIYPLWASESMNEDFHTQYIPSKVEISFKKECLCSQEVVVQTNLENLTTNHSIKLNDDGKECAKIRIVWQKRFAA
ncbi:MAG: hypothetical protein IJS26_04095 [Alphaproteobacteria bacterium]|nr:hypothetical protein [Alphaproteobacteria bacterium]